MVCRRRERGDGGKSCVAERNGFVLPVCKPPPGCRPGGGQVVPVVASGCRCRPFPPDFAGKTPVAGVVPFVLLDIITTELLFFASLLSFCNFSTFSAPAAGPGSGPRRRSDRPGHRPGHSPPLPVTVCPPFGPEHRPPGDSPSLPSPPLFSSGQCSPLVASVLLRCSPALAVLLGSLVLVSALLGVVVYGGIFFFIQPRPE